MQRGSYFGYEKHYRFAKEYKMAYLKYYEASLNILRVINKEDSVRLARGVWSIEFAPSVLLHCKQTQQELAVKIGMN